MTDEQFTEIKKSLADIRIVLLAGFATLAGQHHVAARKKELGGELDTPEYFSKLHEGFDLVLMMIDSVHHRHELEGLREHSDA